MLKKKILQKLDVIGKKYISELSFKEQEKAKLMINEITELLEKSIFQNNLDNQERKEKISPKKFNELLNVVSKAGSFVKQKNMLVMTSLQKKFTVNQVYRLLHCVEEKEDKFTILELLVPSISNPKDMYRLFEYVKNLEAEACNN